MKEIQYKMVEDVKMNWNNVRNMLSTTSTSFSSSNNNVKRKRTCDFDLF